MWKRFGLIVVVVLTPVAGASAITPDEPFTVSPGEGAPLTVVDVSGANCTDGPSPSVAGTVVGSPDVGVVASFVATPDVAGDWAASFTVPPNRPAGSYQVTAQCKTDPNAIEGVDYGPQAFTILEGEEATMTVSPRQAQTGSDVTVTVSGTLCSGADATVELRAFVRGSDADEFVAQVIVTPAADGTWTGQLTIPDSEPATYGVSGQCSVGQLPFILYDTVDVVVSAAAAPPATPLPGQPTFTG